MEQRTSAHASQIVAEAGKAIPDITVSQAREELDQGQGGLMLDVREPSEWEKGHISGAVLAPRGILEWLADKRELTTDVSSYPRTSYGAQAPHSDIRAFRDQILLSPGSNGFALVDVRSPAEYSGELLAPANLPQEGAQRGGHTPGAANLPWSMAVRQDGTLKSADELRSLYQSKGITPEKEVIAYCRIDERSSHTWFVLHSLLGYPHVRNYDGSWTEWGSLIGAPIEK